MEQKGYETEVHSSFPAADLLNSVKKLCEMHKIEEEVLDQVLSEGQKIYDNLRANIAARTGQEEVTNQGKSISWKASINSMMKKKNIDMPGYIIDIILGIVVGLAKRYLG